MFHTYLFQNLYRSLLIFVPTFVNSNASIAQKISVVLTIHASVASWPENAVAFNAERDADHCVALLFFVTL